MKAEVQRLLRFVVGLPDSTPAAAAAPATGSPDAEVLARELSATFIKKLCQYRNAKDGQLGLMELDEMRDGGSLRKMAEKSPDKVTFHDLEALARNNMPEEALHLWEATKAAAREDVANGWHAARGVGFDAWDRACFLAIRDQFRQVWPPRSGVEAMLIDEMTQYEQTRRHLMHMYYSGPWICDGEHGRRYPMPAEMGRTIERLQRLFQSALRTLLGVRRTNAMPVVSRITPTPVAAVPDEPPAGAVSQLDGVASLCDAEAGRGVTGLLESLAADVVAAAHPDVRHVPVNVPE